MIPIELCVLKVSYGPLTFTPTAFLSQYLELTDPTAWYFRKAHALLQGTVLSSYLAIRD